MGALPTLPNYNTQPVQVPDQVAQYARLQALRGQQQELQTNQQLDPLKIQQAQQGVQKGQIDIQDAQQAQAARQALNKAYSGAITTDATGQPTVDSNKLAAGLANTPGAYQTPAVMKGIEDFHKSRIETQTAATDLQAKQADLIGSAAAAVKAAGYDPTLAHSLLDSLPQSPQLQQIRSQIDNPQALKQIVDSAIQNSPKQRELSSTETKDTAQTNEANATTAKTQGETAYYAAHGGAPGVPAEIQQQNDWISKHPGAGPADFLKAKSQMTPNAMVMNSNLLSGDSNSLALDFAADNYRKTGQMPAGLARSPTTTSAIITRAAQLDQQDGGQGIATNKSEIMANRASLNSLQKNFDQVQAFEQTASKNIDLLQQTAQKIPDLGARFANVPVRQLSSQMIGTANMAAFKTALTTAQTEAAKVLNSTNATGVLSDSSRHELQDVIDGNMPLPAMVASLNTLKQDMANRTQSYKAQIGDIQGRIQRTGSTPNTPSAQPGGAAATHRYNQQTGQIEALP